MLDWNDHNKLEKKDHLLEQIGPDGHWMLLLVNIVLLSPYLDCPPAAQLWDGAVKLIHKKCESKNLQFGAHGEKTISNQ